MLPLNTPVNCHRFFAGAHKAVAFTTTALLFELSLPRNAAWRVAVKRELTAAFGVPRCDCAECTAAAARKAAGATATPPTRQSCVQRIMQAAYQRHGSQTVAQASAAAPSSSALPSGGQSVFFTGAGAALSAAAAADVTASLGGAGAPATAADAGSSASASAAGDSASPSWRAPERRDLEAPTTLAVTSRAWRETLRLHVVSLGTLRK